MCLSNRVSYVILILKNDVYKLSRYDTQILYIYRERYGIYNLFIICRILSYILQQNSFN